MEDIPANLQLKLHEYQRALESEMKVEPDDISKESDPLKLAELAKAALAQATPQAVETLYHLAKHAESDGIRLKAATYILDKVIGKEGSADPADPMADLVNKLTKVRSTAQVVPVPSELNELREDGA